MDFNFDTGAIYGGLQSLDVSTLPPLGGQLGVLELIGDGALLLLKGATAARPATPASGMFRYNTDGNVLEYYNGTTWSTLSVGGGTVTSVAASSNTAALTVTGSPITSSGTFTFDLDADLTAIAALSSTGFSARTAADTWALRTITGTAGNVVVTNGAGVAGNPTIDLDTVTQGSTGNFVKITLDTFGRVTGNTAVTTSDITTLVDGTYVNISGDTMTGSLVMATGTHITLTDAPVNATDAANKGYVDTIAAGLSWKQAVVAATTANITLSNATTAIDGVTLANGDRVLVKNQTLPADNGIYIVSTSGAWVRSTDMDSTTPINEVNGAAVFVESGTTQADTAWVQINNVVTVGTDPIEFTQFAGMGTYAAGTGLTLTGNVFSITSPVSVSLGGTGLTTTPTSGQLLIGNGTGYTLSTLTDGTGITITEGAGSITIDNAGVVSITGTTNQITASASTGAVTLSLPSTLIAPGSVQVTSTLTVDTFTPNSMLYVTTGGQVVSTAALTDGQILIGDTGSVPVTGTIDGGSGITVTNGAGTISIAIDPTEVVTTFSGGTTGLTPASATSGAITLAGTLATANGGTGLSTIGTADQFLSVNGGATGLEYKTIAAGTGISVTPGANVLTIANTGVTSVALTAPSIFTVSGSPVTTTGTLDFALNTQTANTVFAGPASGAAAVPTFRALSYEDLPLALYVENPSTPTAPIATGANAVAIGSGSSATADGSFAEGAGAAARVFGQKAYANGSFATAGDAQHGVYVLRNQTIDATATELFLDGAAVQLVLPASSLFVFDILVAGRRTDVVGGGAGYRFVGVARRDASAGSVTFVGTPSKTVIGETNSPWDASVAVDTATGALTVSVNGEVAKDINWVATVMTTEVTN